MEKPQGHQSDGQGIYLTGLTAADLTQIYGSLRPGRLQDLIGRRIARIADLI